MDFLRTCAVGTNFLGKGENETLTEKFTEEYYNDKQTGLELRNKSTWVITGCQPDCQSAIGKESLFIKEVVETNQPIGK
jgi:hypothetical protein